jgi:hypothetical protein
MIIIIVVVLMKRFISGAEMGVSAIAHINAWILESLRTRPMPESGFQNSD